MFATVNDWESKEKNGDPGGLGDVRGEIGASLHELQAFSLFSCISIPHLSRKVKQVINSEWQKGSIILLGNGEFILPDQRQDRTETRPPRGKDPHETSAETPACWQGKREFPDATETPTKSPATRSLPPQPTSSPFTHSDYPFYMGYDHFLKIEPESDMEINRRSFHPEDHEPSFPRNQALKTDFSLDASFGRLIDKLVGDEEEDDLDAQRFQDENNNNDPYEFKMKEPSLLMEVVDETMTI